MHEQFWNNSLWSNWCMIVKDKYIYVILRETFWLLNMIDRDMFSWWLLWESIYYGLNYKNERRRSLNKIDELDASRLNIFCSILMNFVKAKRWFLEFTIHKTWGVAFDRKFKFLPLTAYKISTVKIK